VGETRQFTYKWKAVAGPYKIKAVADDLSEIGESDGVIKADVARLFREACAQRPNNLPYLIFLDLNVMPTPGVPMQQKPWLEDIKAMLDKYKDVSPENPDPFNAVALTNFSYYYGGNLGDAPSGEYVLIVSPHPQFPSRDPNALREIWESLERYSRIPEEV
jgi:hypothetical protein